MKIKIKVLIKNEQEQRINEYNAVYIKDKKIIKYLEKDKTNVTINIKDNILIRENNEIYMKYLFNTSNKTKAEILLKQYNNKINLSIETSEIKIQKDKYYVRYKIIDSNEIFIYEISLSTTI